MSQKLWQCPGAKVSLLLGGCTCQDVLPVLPGCLYCHALILQKQDFKAIRRSVCCDHEAMNLNGSKGEVG